MPGQEADLEPEQVLRDDLLGCHVRDAAQREHGVRTAGDSQASSPVASLTVPSTGLTSMVSVPGLYQLGRNSPTGVWTVVVQATNATGPGAAAMSTLYVTPALVAGLAREVSFVQVLEGIPKELHEVERQACESQVALGPFSTGICRNGLFTRF